jgi:hypothetical protein
MIWKVSVVLGLVCLAVLVGFGVVWRSSQDVNPKVLEIGVGSASAGSAADSRALPTDLPVSHRVHPLNDPTKHEPAATSRARGVHTAAIVSNSDRLTAESILLRGNDIDSAAVAALLKSDDRFDHALDRLWAEMAGDEDAAALGEAYATAIGSQVSDVEGLRLDKLACGLRLCIASFLDMRSGDAWESWRGRFDSDVETPYGVLIEHEIDLGTGAAQRRVVFSTDPSTDAVVIPAYAGG